MILQSFLVALNNPRREGRIFYTPVADEGMQFRYLLLDVSNIFSEIVSSARAVILAGRDHVTSSILYQCSSS